jgi:kynurenine formamidase
MDIKVDSEAIARASTQLSNWGRWGEGDRVGTLNHVRPEDIAHAASLVRSGKVFALGIPLDRDGGRAADGSLDLDGRAITHWDALGRISHQDKAYNGHGARPIDLRVLGIEHAKSKMAGRGVLLDVARFKGVDWLEAGYGISNDELNKCARVQNVEIRRGDFVVIRTGQMERCLKEGDWRAYADGDAPGVRFENCYWCQEHQIAAICADTGGVEVRPNETTDVAQPWHAVAIPAMGLCVGATFYLRELAEDCAEDGIYEFFFCAPPLIITGADSSPINPQAIK